MHLSAGRSEICQIIAWAFSYLYRSPLAVFLRIKGEQPNVWITCIGDVATIRDPGRRVIGRVVMAEFFYRSRASGLTEGDTFVAPISLVQLGKLWVCPRIRERTLLELRTSRGFMVGHALARDRYLSALASSSAICCW
jgi:hypothetical protein